MAESRKRYLSLLACALAAVVVTVVLLTHSRWLPYAFRLLDIGELPVKTDAVFVLFGNNDTRPYVAAALYNVGYADEILMAHNDPLGATAQTRASHEIYRRVFLHRGVPERRIRTLGAQITNTMDESGVLRDYMVENPDAIVTVVTSHYHTRRTRWSLRRHLGEDAERLRFVSAPEDDFSAADWWLYPKGFEMVGMEYIKILGYWVLYGRGLWWIGTGGLCLVLVAWNVYRGRIRRTSSAVGNASDG